MIESEIWVYLSLDRWKSHTEKQNDEIKCVTRDGSIETYYLKIYRETTNSMQTDFFLYAIAFNVSNDVSTRASTCICNKTTVSLLFLFLFFFSFVRYSRCLATIVYVMSIFITLIWNTMIEYVDYETRLTVSSKKEIKHTVE